MPRRIFANLLSRRDGPQPRADPQTGAPATPEEVSFKREVTLRLGKAAKRPSYAAYLQIREIIYRMMDTWRRVDPHAGPSRYWREEIEGFLYLFDASPLMIEKLRHECYHITGIRDYEYRHHHRHKRGDFEYKYGRLKAIDTTGLFVPEAPELGGFGFETGAGKANVDTLKFYEALIGLHKAGALQRFLGRQKTRRTAVEIGAGWGGFAYQVRQLCPNITYVLIDLPPTMLFSGVYLATLYPEAKMLFYGEDGFAEKAKDLSKYDFVFLPHFDYGCLQGQRIDLAINMVSFQEMTSEQVDGYVQAMKGFGAPALYSLNRDRSKHNKQLSTVSEILAQHYEVEPVEVLELQYDQLKSFHAGKEPAVTDYRHLIGRLPR